MTKRMLIDATHSEETRVVVMEGSRLVEFDYESQFRRQLKGNIFLAKVTRVEPSLQAAFVNFGGNRHGFLPFSEIHPDYYRIPVADREELLAQQRAMEEEEAAREAAEEAEEAAREAEEADRNVDDSLDEPLARAEQMESQAEDAQELAAQEVGYLHDEVDLTPSEDEENDPPMDMDAPDIEGDFTGEETILSTEVTNENPEGDTAAADGQGRRGWRRRDRGSGGGRGRRYMGARARRDERSEESGMGGLHARFRRRYKIQEVIKRGQIMLVQVAKEERGNKGAAVTTYLSLPGRYCVLMPNSPRGGGISRKIGNFSDRRRLKDMLRALEIPSGMSVILRTAGVERSEADIKRDYDYLLRLWDNIRNMTLQSSAPALIYEEGDLIKRSIRDIYAQDIDEIFVSGEEGYKEAREFMGVLMPGNEDKIELYAQSKMPLFQRYQVESQITEIGEPIVQLKSGGYLVINQTEALVAVDVNSGRATKERHIEETALKTNLEAADEVARQLRLRDLGGLVVIDFIDMEDRRNNAKVERRLKEALSSDRARIQLSRISTFGLLELSRQRLNPSLTEAQFQKCSHCHGFGFIRSVDSAAILALRALEEEGVRARATQITLHIPNEIAIYILNAKRDMLATIEKRYNFRVMIHVDESLAPSGYIVEPMKAPPAQSESDAEEDGETALENSGPRRHENKKPVAMDETVQDESSALMDPDDDPDGNVKNDNLGPDQDFNRSDVNPDGERPGRRRNGNGRYRNGRDRDRNNKGRDRKGDARASGRGPRRDKVMDGDFAQETSQESSPIKGTAESARNQETGPEKARATYFTARRKPDAPSEHNRSMGPSPDMSSPSHMGDTAAPDAPKKKGWWSHFS